MTDDSCDFHGPPRAAPPMSAFNNFLASPKSMPNSSAPTLSDGVESDSCMSDPGAEYDTRGSGRPLRLASCCDGWRGNKSGVRDAPTAGPDDRDDDGAADDDDDEPDIPTNSYPHRTHDAQVTHTAHRTNNLTLLLPPSRCRKHVPQPTHPCRRALQHTHSPAHHTHRCLRQPRRTR